MKLDDKLFTIVCCCAALITTAVFFGVQQEGFSITLGPPAGTVEVAPALRTADPTPEPEPVAAPGVGFAETAEHAAAAVPAAFVTETVPSPRFADSGQIFAFSAALEALAEGGTGYELPEQREVLVREDADGRLVVAAGTHRRYEAIVESVQSIDVQALMTAAADAEVAAAIAEAVDALLAVALPEVEPDMISNGIAWDFADTEYRGLSAAQKHLLLMGRGNAGMVSSKLGELRQLLSDSGYAPEAIVPPDPMPAATEPVLVAEAELEIDPDPPTEPATP